MLVVELYHNLCRSLTNRIAENKAHEAIQLLRHTQQEMQAIEKKAAKVHAQYLYAKASFNQEAALLQTSYFIKKHLPQTRTEQHLVENFLKTPLLQNFKLKAYFNARHQVEKYLSKEKALANYYSQLYEKSFLKLTEKERWFHQYAKMHPCRKALNTYIEARFSLDNYEKLRCGYNNFLKLNPQRLSGTQVHWLETLRYNIAAFQPTQIRIEAQKKIPQKNPFFSFFSRSSKKQVHSLQTNNTSASKPNHFLQVNTAILKQQEPIIRPSLEDATETLMEHLDAMRKIGEKENLRYPNYPQSI